MSLSSSLSFAGTYKQADIAAGMSATVGLERHVLAMRQGTA